MFQYGLNTFYHPIKPHFRKKIFDMIPELAEGIANFGPVKEFSVLVLNGDTSTLHVDHNHGYNRGVQARLNMPLLNCKGSYTAFFEMDDETFSNHSVDFFGRNYGGLCWTPQVRESLKPTTEVELIQPTILRTSAPHTVFCRTCEFPRISLTISFQEDVVKYLDDC